MYSITSALPLTPTNPNVPEVINPKVAADTEINPLNDPTPHSSSLSISEEESKKSSEIPTIEGAKWVEKVFAIKELVFEILKFSSVQHLRKFELVCKQWKDVCDQVLQKKFSHMMELTKDLKEIPLTDEELYLHIVFSVKKKEDMSANLKKIVQSKLLKKTWNNYYVEIGNDTILIKNINDSKICHEIKNPCIDKFDYFLMNGYLLIIETRNLGKNNLYVWNLKDGSPVDLPDEVIEDFKKNYFSDYCVPYIYKNILVRNLKRRLIVQDLTTLEIANNQFHDASFNESHRMRACFKKTIAIQSTSDQKKISLFDLETKEITCLISIPNLETSDTFEKIVLSSKYVVIEVGTTTGYELKIYTKSKTYSEKTFKLPDQITNLKIVKNLLYGEDRTSNTLIINLSLSEEDFWKYKKGTMV